MGGTEKVVWIIVHYHVNQAATVRVPDGIKIINFFFS